MRARHIEYWRNWRRGALKARAVRSPVLRIALCEASRGIRGPSEWRKPAGEMLDPHSFKRSDPHSFQPGPSASGAGYPTPYDVHCRRAHCCAQPSAAALVRAAPLQQQLQRLHL